MAAAPSSTQSLEINTQNYQRLAQICSEAEKFLHIELPEPTTELQFSTLQTALEHHLRQFDQLYATVVPELEMYSALMAVCQRYDGQLDHFVDLHMLAAARELAQAHVDDCFAEIRAGRKLIQDLTDVYANIKRFGNNARDKAVVYSALPYIQSAQGGPFELPSDDSDLDAWNNIARALERLYLKETGHVLRNGRTNAYCDQTLTNQELQVVENGWTSTCRIMQSVDPSYQLPPTFYWQ